MVSREEQRARVEVALAAHLLDHGLAQTSLRELARAAAVSDRMLLYYFTDKAEVLGCRRAANRRGPCRAYWRSGRRRREGSRRLPSSNGPGHSSRAPKSALYATMGSDDCSGGPRRNPFPRHRRNVLAGFLSWVEAHLAIDEAADRQAVAAMIVAAVDGLAIIDIGRGPDLAARAYLPSVLLADRGT